MKQEDNELILDLLARQSEPIDRKTLLLMSGLDPERFNNAVSFLDSKGELVILKRRMLALPDIAGYERATVLRVNRWFLFAHPEDESMGDVFVHSGSSKGAMPGDTVLLKNFRDSEKGLSAEVDKILEKGTRIITGTIEREGGRKGQAYVLPDSGFAYHLRIAKAATR